MILNLVSHYVMRVGSDSRKKRDVRPPPESRVPMEDQRRLDFRLRIITEVQIIITPTTIIMLHRRLGFTIIRRESLTTRRRITNILLLMTSGKVIMRSQPTRSCLGGSTSPTGPALPMILRCDELSFLLKYHLA